MSKQVVKVKCMQGAGAGYRVQGSPKFC